MTAIPRPALSGTPVLETERLVLRAPLAGDWPAWRDFALSERAAFIGGPFTLAGAWRSLCHVTGMWSMLGFGCFVFCDRTSGAPLGHAGPWQPIEWPEPELGWCVWAPEAEGRGYAFEAVTCARRFAYEVLGWSAPVSYIDHDNARSIALAKRLGAVEDPDAATPPGETCRVFRHPKVLA